MLGVLALPPVLLAEDTVIGEALADQPAHHLLRRPVGDGDRIEGGPGELVLDLEPRPEPRQDRTAGRLGQFVEEAGEDIGGRSGAHADLVAQGDRPSLATERRAMQAPAIDIPSLRRSAPFPLHPPSDDTPLSTAFASDSHFVDEGA